jgi:short-subunit dehydrogenase
MPATIAIVGAGPGLGLSLARAFGHRDHRVGLLARRRQQLDDLVSTLVSAGIEAAGFEADVSVRGQLRSALGQLAATLGPVTVLEYGPMPDMTALSGTAAGVSADNAGAAFEFCVQGAIEAVTAVLPGMQDRGSGALLFTTGASALVPMPRLANLGISMAALRSWAGALHAELAPQGIYVGTVCVGTRIQPGGGDGDPDRIAQLYLDMCAKADRFEELVPPERFVGPGA